MPFRRPPARSRVHEPVSPAFRSPFGSPAPQRPRIARTAAGLLACTAVVVALAACSTSSKTPKTSSTTSGAAGSATSTSRQVNVALTAKGCVPEHSAYPSGPLTFVVKNTDATAVSEVEVLSADRILGERENLAPGFSSSFSLALTAGTYTVYCPGADQEKSTITVTGQAAAAIGTTHGLLVAGAKGYLGFVRTQVAGLTAGVATLDKAIRSGNVTAAQTAYDHVRPYYERIEPVAESFVNLDAAIDARATPKIPITKITGFHRIEYGLFSKKSVAGLVPVSAGLVGNVGKLSKLVAGLTGFQPAELANGAVGLLQEAAKNKITGEEERYSGIDLVDFAANVEGADQAYAYLEPGLTKIDPVLTKRVRTAFTNVEKLIAAQRDPAQPSGYKLYSAISTADLGQLSQALLAVSGPLSTVGGKVVSA